jgi:hypothetical protein
MKHSVGDLVLIQGLVNKGDYEAVVINDINVVSSVGAYDYQGTTRDGRHILFNECIILDKVDLSAQTPKYSIAKYFEAHSRLLDLLK